MNPFTMLFDFRGRINRARFWLSLLIYVIFFTAVIAIASLTSTSLDTVLLVALFAYIPMVMSAVAVGIKRLHDRDKSAWWLVLFATPLVLPFIAAALDDVVIPETTLTFTIAQYAGFVITIWAFIELGCLRGTIGANQYGSDPLAPQPAPPRTLMR
jgi:uncharacterized membrane protein YhaH (DUF805 family)